MPNERRVVITGLGVITPLGIDLQTFWSNITSGVSGIAGITAFDAAEFDCRIGGEVKNFEPVRYFKNAKDVRRTDRYAHFAMAAARIALADGGLDPATYPNPPASAVSSAAGSAVSKLSPISTPFS